ncbi:hypothetical protein Bmyc01_13590 [Bacillus mycoides]|nr:hypothetical protein Bmyc01_13590 [Bacillus mycoides]
MKVTKLVSLAIPVLLLVGCGVGDKDSTPKTEEVSKKKVKISEEKYPLYICEQMVEFQNKLDGYSNTVVQVFKGTTDVQDVLKSIYELEQVLDNIENIESPSKYKDQQKSMQEGVDEARKGIELLNDGFTSYADGNKEDKVKAQKLATEGGEVLNHADKDFWHPVIKSLVTENPEVYEQALRNKSH